MIFRHITIVTPVEKQEGNPNGVIAKMNYTIMKIKSKQQ